MLRDEDTFEEETELFREDTDLEPEREEREDDPRDELRFTADDLDTGGVDLRVLTELATPLPPLRSEEERDEEELELIFLVDEFSILELDDLLKFEESEGEDPEFRLLFELTSFFSLDG